ncbi:MAG: phosphoglucosamine mutase [Candidatus Kapabacteria bacterium]|nr:phosphoglucosamine mutase [Candidatus Kapabacteria bacterium]
MSFVRSISGIRATLGDDMTPDMVAKYVLAFAKATNLKKIAVGRDGRPSGAWIEKIVSSTLSSRDVECNILGIVPTPTVQLMVEKFDYDAGIVITASHNPEQWNGLKFLNSNGVFLNETENQKVWDLVDSGLFENDIENHAEIKFSEIEPIDFHIKSVTNSRFISERLGIIKSRKFKVVVDAVNASGSIIIPKLLKGIGCDVIAINCEGNGEFPHVPEPLPQYLTELSAKVAEVGADVGFAVDPDADRLVLVDESGTCVSEEKTIALAIQSLMSASNDESKKNAVVNLSTSSYSEWAASQFGGKVARCPVGEINVVSKMKEIGAIIGGEGSGGVILPNCHYGRDSLVGICLILSLMAQSNRPLSELSNDFPAYEMKKLKFDFEGNFENLKSRIIEEISSVRVNLEDGLRIDTDSFWIHIRKSNTEPIIRLIYEKLNDSNIDETIDKIKSIITDTK